MEARYLPTAGVRGSVKLPIRRPTVVVAIAVAAIGIAIFIVPRLSEVAFVVRNAQLAARVVAKDICYGRFLQGRSEADVRASELGPYLDPRLSWARADIDEEARAVEARFLRVFRARAVQLADGSCVFGEAVGGPGGAARQDGLRSTGEAPDRSVSGPTDSAMSPDPAPWPAGEGLSPEAASIVPDMAALRDAVEAEFAPTDFGTDRGTRSVLIIHRGELVYERHADGWTRHIPQNGRSMTKVVPALLAGVAAGRQSVSLADDSLRSEWTDARAGIRLDHLLTMRSGLSWQEANGPGDSAEATLMAANAADYAASKSLEFDPGTRFRYSAGDAELALAAVLDRLTRGESAEDARGFAGLGPETILFDALGMHSVVMDRDPSGAPIASTFMYASATDWARLGLFLARDGVWDGQRILPEGWVAFMRSPTSESRCNYGAMIWIRGGCTDGRAAEVVELSGFMGQGVTVVPASETIVVRTGFGPWVMGDLLDRVFDALGIEAPTRMAMEVES